MEGRILEAPPRPAPESGSSSSSAAVGRRTDVWNGVVGRLHPRPRVARAAILLARIGFAFVTRWWFLPHRLKGWDPVKQAFGMRDFDVYRHTPHPPVAPTHHSFLRSIHALVGDAAATVLWSGVVLSVQAGIAGFALGAAVPAKSGQRTPGLVGLSLLISPALWLDNVSGGSCAGDAALSAVVGLFCYRMRTRRHVVDAITGALALAILIGFRQNVNLASLCLLPLWIWGLLPCIPRARLVGLAVLVAGCAAQAIPTAGPCGGWSAWLAPTFQHAGLCNYQGNLGDKFTAGGLLSLAGPGEAELGVHLGMLWIPVTVACLCCLLRREWRASPHVAFTCLWLLPLAAGITLTPTHMHEYAAVALPVLCWWAAAGLSHLTSWAARRIQAARTLRMVPSPVVRRGLLLSSASTIVFCNVFVFLLMRSSEPEADSYYKTLGRIGRRFDPASTVIVSSGLGQRYASLAFPEFTSVYLAALLEDPWEPYAGRIFRNGVERTFGGHFGIVPRLERPEHTVVVTDPCDIVCEPPLVVHDLVGQSRFIDGGENEINVRYKDKRLIVTAAPAATAAAEHGPKGHGKQLLNQSRRVSARFAGRSPVAIS